jgi:arginine N-succinyltransferase
LLARSRYMLAAAFPDLFSPLLMAEMRGWQDGAGRSPFWDAVGARFFNMDFATADRISAVRGSDFIADLMPRYPIPIDLLPDSARAVIGKPHDDSAPAMALLLREGFRFEGYVDVFDAGPQVHCNRDTIATVRLSREGPMTIASPAAEGETRDYLICNTALDQFRVVMAAGRVCDGEIAVGADTARALDVMVEGSVRWSPGSLAGAS